MHSLKSMIFGEKPKAVKWLGMGQEEKNDTFSNSKMFVHTEASRKVLDPLGDELVNLISIFGAARQGKSFLMNLLADQQDLFKISNLREPCTQGVDLSGHFVPLEKFSSFNDCPPLVMRNKQHQQQKSIQIGFVDAEGQGDRDITYDSRLVSPVLLASKAVIFNWKDSLQADRILNLLAVLARAAQGIEVGEGDNMKVFGNLHIVFRDWSFVDSTPKEVYDDLFRKEKGHSEEVNVRNLARLNLIDAFESITVWLFPAPVANTANLKDKIRFEQLQRPFQEKLREFRKTLSHQLQKPMLFNRKPLTARLLVQMMPVLVETLNSNSLIMPESIYSSMVRAEAKAIRVECEKSISAYCETCLNQQSNVLPEKKINSKTLEQNLQKDIELMINDAMEGIKGSPESVQKEMENSLLQFATKEIQLVLKSHEEKLTKHFSILIGQIFSKLQSECTVIENALLPMREDHLEKRCDQILKTQLDLCHQYPVHDQLKQIEMERIKQHAQILFQKLFVSNEKSITKAYQVLQEYCTELKKLLTKQVFEMLDKKFANMQKPLTVAILQSELDQLYRNILLQLDEKAKQHHLEDLTITEGMKAFKKDLENHKKQIAEDMNRRYLVEIRQLLNQIGFEAKEELQKLVRKQMDKKIFPMLLNINSSQDKEKEKEEESEEESEEELIGREIEHFVQQVKVNLSEKLQGWTVLKSDISSKSIELEKMGDLLQEEYLVKAKELKKNVRQRIREQEYEKTKEFIRVEFENKILTLIGKLEKKEEHVLDDLLTEMIQEKSKQLKKKDPEWEEIKLQVRLEGDLFKLKDHFKKMNRLAMEKATVKKQMEKEKALRENQLIATLEKDKQMEDLKNLIENSITERNTQTERLNQLLEEESIRSQQLQTKIDLLLSEQKKLQAENLQLLKKVQEESLRRQQAEEAAQQAAEAAQRSALYAAEAARNEVTPIKFKQETESKPSLKKRKISEIESEKNFTQEDGKENHHVAMDESMEEEESLDSTTSTPTVISKQIKKTKRSDASPGNKKSFKTGVRLTKKRSTPVKDGKINLADVRRKAQEEVAKRAEERINLLTKKST